MKKILHIFLTSVFIYNLIGFFVIFQVLQYQAKKDIKRTIKSKLPAAELVVITISPENSDDIKWFEDGKEFMYHNQMYDIVKKNQNGNTTQYYCINDKQEKELFSNLKKHIEKHVNNNIASNKKTKSVIQNVIKDYFFVPVFSYQTYGVKMHVFATFKYPILKGSVEHTTPPPKNIC